MKNIFLIICFVCCSKIVAGTTDSLRYPGANYYCGVGIGQYNNIQLNRTLSNNYLGQINKNDLIIILGFDYNQKLLGLNFETSLYSSTFNNPNKIKFICFPIRAGINGNIYRGKKSAVSVNVNYNYSGYFGSVYYGNNVVNANYITQSNGSVLELTNNTQNIGFQIIFKKLIRSKTSVLRLGYDLPIKNSQWISRNNILSSFPKERINKIYFSLCLPIGKSRS